MFLRRRYNFTGFIRIVNCNYQKTGFFGAGGISVKHSDRLVSVYSVVQNICVNIRGLIKIPICNMPHITGIIWSAGEDIFRAIYCI